MTPTEGSNLFALETVTCIPETNSKFTPEKMGGFGICFVFFGMAYFQGLCQF